MFNSVSMAGTGVVITLIESVLKLFGIDFPDGSVGQAVNGAVAILGLVLLVVGQLRRKDLNMGFFRKG